MLLPYGQINLESVEGTSRQAATRAQLINSIESAAKPHSFSVDFPRKILLFIEKR
jgi:hypothetical protein